MSWHPALNSRATCGPPARLAFQCFQRATLRAWGRHSCRYSGASRYKARTRPSNRPYPRSLQRRSNYAATAGPRCRTSGAVLFCEIEVDRSRLPKNEAIVLDGRHPRIWVEFHVPPLLALGPVPSERERDVLVWLSRARSPEMLVNLRPHKSLAYIRSGILTLVRAVSFDHLIGLREEGFGDGH